MSKAILIFAHGARDPEWAQPFESLRDAVATQKPNARVTLAYLEFMQPALAEALDDLIATGATDIDIVPAFMAQGGHLKRDLPLLIDAARLRHPNARLTLQPALGEAPGVIAAMARHIAASTA